MSDKVGAACLQLLLPNLGRAFQVLHDTKHFVKDYSILKGSALLPSTSATVRQPDVEATKWLVLCKAILPNPPAASPSSVLSRLGSRSAPLCSSPGRAGAAGLRAVVGEDPGPASQGAGHPGVPTRAQALAGPPQEWVQVPRNATVAQLRCAAAAHYARMYRMFRDVKVSSSSAARIGLQRCMWVWQRLALTSTLCLDGHVRQSLCCFKLPSLKCRMPLWTNQVSEAAFMRI